MENEQVDKDAILEVNHLEEFVVDKDQKAAVLQKLNIGKRVIIKSDITRSAKRFKFLLNK